MAKKKVTRKATAKKSTGAKRTTKRTVKKKAADKRTVKKKAAVKKSSGTAKGIERDHDVPWNDKKVALFKALKELKAFAPDSARSAKDVANHSGGVLDTNDVRHYSYHARAAGLTDVADLEGVRGYSFYLTKKGKEVDPVKAQKAEKKD